MKRTILQNKHRNIAGLVIASVFSLAACGGGGGGGDDRGGGGGGGLASGTFTRTFNDTSGGTNVIPFGVGVFSDVTYQGLYTAAEVGAAGRITMLRFRSASGDAGVTCPNTTIRLAHSSVATLTGAFATDTNVGTPVVVLNNATLTIPSIAALSTFDIPLTTSFDYNGVDNLIVQVDRTTACSASFRVTTGSIVGRRAISVANDLTPGTADNNTAMGSVDTSVAWMQFVFTGGDNKLDFGGVSSNFWPFSLQAPLRTQHLYLASEINGSGPITGIAFQMNVVSVAGTYTYTLRLGHSTLPALGTTFASNYSGSPTTVANAVSFSIPAGVPSGEWIWVPIPDSVFVYNGTDNLIVDVTTTAGTADNTLRETGIAGRRLSEAGLNPTTGNLASIAYHMTLRFHGARIVKLSAGTGINNAIFAGSFSTATFYSASDLGTAGSITSVSCRLFSPSTAASYANFRVVMGHSTVSTLTTPATDFVSQNTVFNGTVDVPGGLLPGDWIDIPLTTPFAYDGTRNLIVWMGNGGAPSGTGTVQNCRAENNAVRYPGGIGLSMTGVGSATYDSGVVGWTTDLRMTIQK